MRVNDFSAEMVKSIGIAELLGAIGLIAPQLTGILPVLTPIAAVCLAIIMVLAAIYHFRKGEYQAIGFNTVLLVVALVVAYVRFKQ